MENQRVMSSYDPPCYASRHLVWAEFSGGRERKREGKRGRVCFVAATFSLQIVELKARENALWWYLRYFYKGQTWRPARDDREVGFFLSFLSSTAAAAAAAAAAPLPMSSPLAPLPDWFPPTTIVPRFAFLIQARPHNRGFTSIYTTIRLWHSV